MRACFICAGENVGFSANIRAATPQVWGLDIEVHDLTDSEVLEVIPQEVIADPGPKRDTQVP